METSIEEGDRKQEWFEWYVRELEANSVRNSNESIGPFGCPCCRSKTLDERGGYDICPVCFWEDDGQDDPNADLVYGGPNGSLSLSQARANFSRFGACEERFISKVRPALPEELPD